jgi:hypothetical protein
MDSQNQRKRGQLGRHAEDHHRADRYVEEDPDGDAAEEPGDALSAGE